LSIACGAGLRAGEAVKHHERYRPAPGHGGRKKGKLTGPKPALRPDHVRSIQRRRLEPRLPPASTAPYKPEPTLPQEDYENILKIIQDMTLVMERSPSSFAHMGEEDFRQHFGSAQWPI
jgi:hypothetical protein